MTTKKTNLERALSFNKQIIAHKKLLVSYESALQKAIKKLTISERELYGQRTIS